jgi:hypothetical protein
MKAAGQFLGLLPILFAWSLFGAEPSLRLEGLVGPMAEPTRGAIHAITGTPMRLRVVGGSGTGMRWWQIVPDTAQYYKNANHPWEPRAYQWVGFGRIEYRRVELTQWRGRSEVEVKLSECFVGTSHSPYYHADLGSFWLQVEDDAGHRSAGLEENGERGLSSRVFRLTLEKDASYLGKLTGFFNVPGLFGCTPDQSYHYVGIDCADVLVAAHRRWVGLGKGPDSNVTWIVDHWRRVSEFQVVGGIPRALVKWESEVRPGDAIAVRYTPGKAFQHIGALFEDHNHNGRLDAADTIVHAGPQALHLSALREGGFDGEVVILRSPERG